LGFIFNIYFLGMMINKKAFRIKEGF